MYISGFVVYLLWHAGYVVHTQIFFMLCVRDGGQTLGVSKLTTTHIIFQSMRYTAKNILLLLLLLSHFFLFFFFCSLVSRNGLIVFIIRPIVYFFNDGCCHFKSVIDENEHGIWTGLDIGHINVKHSNCSILILSSSRLESSTTLQSTRSNCYEFHFIILI